MPPAASPTTVYTAVVTYSGLLAAWYLFVAPETRIGRVRSTAAWAGEPDD